MICRDPVGPASPREQSKGNERWPGPGAGFVMEKAAKRGRQLADGSFRCVDLFYDLSIFNLINRGCVFVPEPGWVPETNGSILARRRSAALFVFLWEPGRVSRSVFTYLLAKIQSITRDDVRVRVVRYIFMILIRSHYRWWHTGVRRAHH